MWDGILVWAQANPIIVVVAGVALLVLGKNGSLDGILAKVWEVLKGVLTPKSPTPGAVSVGPVSPVIPAINVEPPTAVVGHFLAIKSHCKDCPEAQSALKALWIHLEPHMEAGK